MAIQTLSMNVALGEIRAEVVYTKARLQADAHARDLAPAFEALVTAADATARNQQLAWDAEIEADALVDAADEGLDGVVRRFADQLLFVVKERTSARFTLYFDQKPANIIRLGLESELEKVKPWPAKIQGEPEAELKNFAAQFSAVMVNGEGSIQKRVTAQTNRAVQRVREIQKLVDDVNAARRSVYGTLVSRAAEQRLDSDWPERFFRHIVRTAKAPAGQAVAAPAAAKT